MTKKKMVAALFVKTNGSYFDLDQVDPWDEKRDARKYKGPHPVVAHPPCARWCMLAGFVESFYGYKRGEDGGCFKSALRSVQKYGGVLEHPAYSAAWKKFKLPRPDRHGGWIHDGKGYSCHVDQGHYGHPAKKSTWLYYVGKKPPPILYGENQPEQRRA